jgi:segregation and condensation protein B
MGGAVADEPTRDNLVADDPVVDDLAADEPLADDLLTDNPLADKPLTGEPLADDSVADDLVADDPVVDDLGPDGLRPDDLSGEPDSAGSGDAHHVDAAAEALSPDAGEDTAENTAEDAGDEELPELDDHELEKALEALLLVVDTPVEEDVLATALGTSVDRVIDTLNRMAGHLSEHERGLDLRRAGGGWRFYTRDKYAPYVEKMLLDGQRAKLTRAALETLAVIAYRQPVTRARVAAVRGVNCDGVIRTLLARGLVEETGTDVDTGGYLYRTTELFLERLGLSSLEDLPPIAPLLPEVDSIDDI